MTNVGKIVSDDEVRAMIPLIKSIGPRETFVIKAVEAQVKRHCRRDFAIQAYADEEYDIDTGELQYAGTPTINRRAFMLKQVPVTGFTSVKQVVSRSSETGAVASTETIARDAYWVDPTLGVVNLLEAITIYSTDTLLNMGLVTSWPKGKAILICTYTAGYLYEDLASDSTLRTANAVAMPDDLKMAVIQIIDRYLHMSEQQLYHLQTQQGEFANTTPVRGLTADEKRLLTPHVRQRLF
jgi:hypothetical protein